MLKIVLLYLFLSTTKSMNAQVVASPREDSVHRVMGNFRTVCMPALSNESPLFVVDGKVTSFSEIKELDAALIEEIQILKPEAAASLYHRPTQPVIVINLKKSIGVIEIVSGVNGSVVPFADVRLFALGNADSIVARTDANGRLVMRNMFSEGRYLIQVRAFQFRPIFDTISLISGISKKIELAPESKELEAVIVSAKGKVWRCSVTCRLGGLTACLIHKNNGEPTLNERLPIFPNPAKKGQSIRVDLQHLDQDDLQIQVHQVLGQKVYDSKVAGRQIVSLPIDSRWAAGVYLISVATEKEWLYREKIIVE